jgi:signal transduction histidine kinase
VGGAALALLAAWPRRSWGQAALPAEHWPAWASAGLLCLLLILGLLLLLVWMVWRQRSHPPRQRSPQPQASPAAPAPPGEAIDSAQESFAYTVSHDLRAPIRVVEGFTKILKEDYGPQLDRIGNDHLERILGAATRMNLMIDALLALSQLSSQPLGRQAVDLSQLAQYVAEDLRRQHPGRNVVLHVEDGLSAQGDPTLLRVVLENLLGNAWKYTGKCAHAEIWFERHALEAAAFTVRDNGAGFDMRFAERLFGVFQRLHSVNDFAGTGVGLASVRRIVRRHGGEIWAEAEVDKGARFHFSLGAAPGGAPAPRGR